MLVWVYVDVCLFGQYHFMQKFQELSAAYKKLTSDDDEEITKV